jgi:hypothetical protein
MSILLNKFTKFFNLKDLIQNIIIIVITVLVTTYCNDSRQNINNYRRLSLELEWNLSELKDYDKYLEKIENYVNSNKLLSVKEGQLFNPALPFPIGITYVYSLVNNNNTYKNIYSVGSKFDIQTRNYNIDELKKVGFCIILKIKNI